MRDDDVIDALLLPFSEGQLTWPDDGPDGGVLFLRARDGAALRREPLPGLVCEQSFKPEAEALQRAGFAWRDADVADAEDPPRLFPLVLVLPTRQREETRALLARAVRFVRPGGRVLACLPNSEGARTAQGDLERLAGPVGALSKHKCRAFWTHPIGASIDATLLEQWLRMDALRPVGDGAFVSRPGLFAWDRVDPATALLATHLPTDLSGRIADLGAGHGVLSALLLQRCPKVKGIDLFEAEARALAAARVNLAPYAERVALAFHWHDVTNGLPRTFDAIVSNPPFHRVGRAALPEVGQRFIAVAASALRPGGSLWMVANRHLPYEAVLTERFGLVNTIIEAEGYKVMQAVKTVRKRT